MPRVASGIEMRMGTVPMHESVSYAILMRTYRDLAALYAAKSTGRVKSSYKYCMRIYQN